jgi:hypothetical protein
MKTPHDPLVEDVDAYSQLVIQALHYHGEAGDHHCLYRGRNIIWVRLCSSEVA